MEASIATIGQQVFVGKQTVEIAAGQDGYERLVQEVGDRVLTGYSVKEVVLTPGVTTSLAVTVIPWGDVIRDVVVEVDFGGLSPELSALLQRDMGAVEDTLASVLVGLPIEATDWAGGVSKSVMREVLADQLPEFRANFDIISGPKTIVKLTLVPQGPVIRDTTVSLRSHTIPNILLNRAKPAVKEAGKMLNGLPVAFVDRHSDYFIAQLSSAAQNHPVAREYGLMLSPAVSSGTETAITVQAETTKYRLWLEGYLDIGSQNKNTTSFKMHAGKFVGNRDELYTEVELIPSTVSWRFAPGWSHQFSPTTFAGAKYDFSDQTAVLTLNQYFGRDWSVRAERELENNRYEAALRYKLHDFVSAEYVVTTDRNWLRLVGNL